MIQVIAIVTTVPGQTQNFLAEFNKVSPKVRQESGCIEYFVSQDAETDLSRQTKFGVDIVLIIEKWRSLDELKKHLATAHMAAYKAATKDFVESTVLRILEPIEM